MTMWVRIMRLVTHRRLKRSVRVVQVLTAQAYKRSEFAASELQAECDKEKQTNVNKKCMMVV